MSYSGFSQTISQGDTLFQITAAQLRATSRIFVEHDFLKTENSLLTERVLLLEHTVRSKDAIIGLQLEQIVNLNSIIITKDTIATNNEAMITSLKSQIEAERKRQRRNMFVGVGVVVVVGVLVIIL